MQRQDIRSTIAVIAVAAMLPLPAIAAKAVQPSAAVRVKKDDRGKLLEFTHPIVQKKGNVVLSVTGIRRLPDSARPEAMELVVSVRAQGEWDIDSFKALDAKGKRLDGGYNITSLATNPLSLSVACGMPSKGTQSLSSVNMRLAPGKIRQKIGTLTVEQLRYPCLLAGRVAIQMGDWTIATWPGHYLRTLFDRQDASFNWVPDPTDKARHMVMRIFTMYRPGDDWANEPIKVIASDASGKELLQKSLSQLGGELLPVQAARSYWGLYSILAPAAQAKSAGVANAALVKEVDPFGPAAAAGIKNGDIITAWAGKEIDSYGMWTGEALETVPGRKAEITIQRDGKTIKLSATAVPNPEWEGIDEPAKASADWLHKKVGLEQGAHFYMNSFIMPFCKDGSPVPEDFKPAELSFYINARPDFINPVSFDIRNIPIPAEFWK